jgi:type I restriction enzyme S subunit
MKAGWKTAKLEEVCDGITDGSHFSPKTTEVGFPYITVRDIENDQVDFDNCKFVCEASFNQLLKNGCKPNRGDILFSKDGTVGKVALIDYEKNFVVLSSLAIIRPNKERIDSTFLKYAMKSPAFLDEAVGKKTGVAIRRIILRNLKSIPVPVPPLHEQQQIVDILDEAFDGIATAKANAEKNLHNARALFESHLQSVFTQRGDHLCVPIGDVAEVFDGPHATPKTVESGPIFLGISALQDGRINLGETRHVTPEDFRRWTRRVRPQTNDVVFSYETRLGQAAIIPDGLECCLGRRMGLVRPNPKRVDPRFFVYQYISPPFLDFLSSRTVRGATVDRIPLKEFPSFPITLPPLTEQQRMANKFDSLREETQRLESLYQQKLAALDALKKSLLHQAFAGQL